MMWGLLDSILQRICFHHPSYFQILLWEGCLDEVCCAEHHFLIQRDLFELANSAAVQAGDLDD
jgi:hypothetical protein